MSARHKDLTGKYTVIEKVYHIMKMKWNSMVK